MADKVTMPIPRPEGWGDDELSRFVDNAYHNTLATFDNLRPHYSLLQDIDQLFTAVLSGIVNPSDPTSALLLLRSHCSYRGAVRFALSGQVAETFMVARGCLEAGLYAYCIGQDPSLGKAWADRHSTDKAKNDVRNRFRIGTLKKTLASKDEQLARAFTTVYDNTIDYGAHPNERSVFSSVNVIEKEKSSEFRLLYLDGNSLALHFAMKSAGLSGAIALKLVEHTMPVRFTSARADVGVDEVFARLNSWTVAQQPVETDGRHTDGRAR